MCSESRLPAHLRRKLLLVLATLLRLRGVRFAQAGRDGSQRVGFPGAAKAGTHLPRARVEAQESAVGVEEIGMTDHDIDPNLRVENERAALVLVPVPMCRRVRRRT